MNIKNILKSKG